LKILSVVGARPNFMKIAPFIRAVDVYNKNGNPFVEHILVHTGQHYDDRMSRSFFEALEIPEADINLGVGSGTHAEQVGQTMIAFEEVLRAEKGSAGVDGMAGGEGWEDFGDSLTNVAQNASQKAVPGRFFRHNPQARTPHLKKISRRLDTAGLRDV